MNQIGLNRHGMVRIFRFYCDGFRNMTVGRTLWKIIIIKLIIMFGVLKLFFFPNFLNSNFTTDLERAEYVTQQITFQPASTHKKKGGKNHD
ncbi:MAG: DUF4492 domain-containing protein [Desulfobulbaceae bacterium]|nr:DUF4492 domain-containing protein [Desulfobulbaceae bacterium]